MFTLKFILDSESGYASYQCERYEVSNGIPATRVSAGIREEVTGVDGCAEVRMYRRETDPLPHVLLVGNYSPYSRCFVMNEAGKTIDRIE